jgi:hypothetical protein
MDCRKLPLIRNHAARIYCGSYKTYPPWHWPDLGRRTNPGNSAICAGTVDALAGGNRFVPGLGVSGPRIVEWPVYGALEPALLRRTPVSSNSSRSANCSPPAVSNSFAAHIESRGSKCLDRSFHRRQTRRIEAQVCELLADRRQASRRHERGRRRRDRCGRDLQQERRACDAPRSQRCRRHGVGELSWACDAGRFNTGTRSARPNSTTAAVRVEALM